MKKLMLAVFAMSVVFGFGVGNASAQMMSGDGNPMVGGAAMYKNKDIIDNAVNSKDHTTLVAAVKAADLVETLKGKGPFTARQITEIAEAFAYAHELGMATILWCYLRNNKFKTDEGDMHTAADLTGQANHLGVTIQADIIKQKLPERNGGYNSLNLAGNPTYGKTNKLVYEKLTTDNPIDLVRYQVANCYMGRCGLINSGGESKGESDLTDAVRTAVINKRGGGTGLISGRKAFQRPFKEGVDLLNAIQEVYLSKKITVA
jgi:class I fructose-bisphosphate aldolase